MTSFDELLGTRDVPVVLRAPKPGLERAALAWLHTFAAAAAQTLLTIIVMLGLLATVPAAFGQISTTVMSDSMEPGLHAGDVVIVRPMTVKKVKIGQVLLVDDPDFEGRLRLHRLVQIRNGDSLVLKGDANQSNDGTPVATDKLLGAGWLRVPWIGLPVFWLRTGAMLPLGGAVAALLVVAALAASDRGDGTGHRSDSRDGSPSGRGRSRTLVALRRRLRRLSRSKGAQAGGTLLLAVGLVATMSVTHPDAAAAFNGVTTSPSNSIATGTFDCPARPVSSTNTVLYYSYMSPTGTAETDIAGSPAINGQLGSTATRVVGNCSNGGGSSPAVALDGTANSYVAASTPVTLDPNYVDEAIWFWAPATATKHQGVLVSFGASNGATPATATNQNTGDMQVYFQTDGSLAFQMGRPGNTIAGCAVPTVPATGAWHLATLNFVAATKRFDLFLDNGGTGKTCTNTTNQVTTSSGYWRFGSDVPLDTTIPSGFIGQIDETAIYKNASLSPATMNTIYTRGH